VLDHPPSLRVRVSGRVRSRLHLEDDAEFPHHDQAIADFANARADVFDASAKDEVRQSEDGSRVVGRNLGGRPLRHVGALRRSGLDPSYEPSPSGLDDERDFGVGFVCGHPLSSP
jgi:hypothetical protein